MYEGELERFVVGPDGERMTVSDLPPADTKRWVARVKARIVVAVDCGLISREAALKRYRLTEEELESWRASLSRFGMRGLRVTKISRRRAEGIADRDGAPR